MEIPPGLRIGDKRMFNFPLNDWFVLDIVSHLVHTALFTVLVDVGEAPALEAIVAIFFLAPEAADIMLAGNGRANAAGKCLYRFCTRLHTRNSTSRF